MTCEDVQLLWMDYMDQELSDVSKYALEAHIRSCELCAKELNQLQFLFDRMADEKPMLPNEGLRKKFNAMLQSELNLQATQAILRKDVTARVLPLHYTSFIWKVAAACILLSTGVAIGISIKSRSTNASSEQLSEMKKDIKDMKETLMFNLLKDESASQRIKAVGYAEEMPNPDRQIIQALITTLNGDKNANVRLAALYSISRFSDDRDVREALVQSLSKQTEPILQIMLINILMEKKETKAVQPIRDIIAKESTIREVKEAGKKALQQL